MKGQQKAVRTAADVYLVAGVQMLEGVRQQFLVYLKEKETQIGARLVGSAVGVEKVVREVWVQNWGE